MVNRITKKDHGGKGNKCSSLRPEEKNIFFAFSTIDRFLSTQTIEFSILQFFAANEVKWQLKSIKNSLLMKLSNANILLKIYDNKSTVYG